MSNTPAENIDSLKRELHKRSEFFSAILKFLRENGTKTKSEITQHLVDSFQIRKELMDIPKRMEALSMRTGWLGQYLTSIRRA